MTKYARKCNLEHFGAFLGIGWLAYAWSQVDGWNWRLRDPLLSYFLTQKHITLTYFTYNIHLFHLQHPHSLHLQHPLTSPTTSTPTSPTTSTYFTKKFCGGDSFSKSINRLVHHKTKGEHIHKTSTTHFINNTISAASFLLPPSISIHLFSYPSPTTLPYSLNLSNLCHIP